MANVLQIMSNAYAMVWIWIHVYFYGASVQVEFLHREITVLCVASTSLGGCVSYQFSFQPSLNCGAWFSRAFGPWRSNVVMEETH